MNKAPHKLMLSQPPALAAIEQPKQKAVQAAEAHAGQTDAAQAQADTHRGVGGHYVVQNGQRVRVGGTQAPGFKQPH